MAEYLIQEETLTNLGDKIRILSGTEDTMTPAEMNTNLTEANTEVSTQADLIAQIATTLEGKAGGSGGASVGTCTLKITTDMYGLVWLTKFVDGKIVNYGNPSTPVNPATVRDDTDGTYDIYENVLCGSRVEIRTISTNLTDASFVNAVVLDENNFTVTETAGETAIVDWPEDEGDGDE